MTRWNCIARSCLPIADCRLPIGDAVYSRAASASKYVPAAHGIGGRKIFLEHRVRGNLVAQSQPGNLELRESLSSVVPEPRKAGEVRVGSCDERRLLSAYHTISVLCHSALDLRICAHCVRGLSTSETMRCGLNQFRRTSAASIFYASALPPIGISIRCARVGGGKRYVSWRPYPFRKARSENQRDDRSKK